MPPTKTIEKSAFASAYDQTYLILMTRIASLRQLEAPMLQHPEVLGWWSSAVDHIDAKI